MSFFTKIFDAVFGNDKKEKRTAPQRAPTTSIKVPAEENYLSRHPSSYRSQLSAPLRSAQPLRSSNPTPMAARLSIRPESNSGSNPNIRQNYTSYSSPFNNQSRVNYNGLNNTSTPKPPVTPVSIIPNPYAVKKNDKTLRGEGSGKAKKDNSHLRINQVGDLIDNEIKPKTSKKKKNTKAKKIQETKGFEKSKQKAPKGFALPEETLSLEDYYKSFNLVCKDGIYVEGTKKNETFLIGSSFNYNENGTGTKQTLKPTKALPEIYEMLLNEARSKGKSINEKLLKTVPFEEEIYKKLNRVWFRDAEGAANKFQIYNYLQLVIEYLDADEPVARHATIGFEDMESKNLRKMLNVKKQTLLKTQAANSKNGNNVMIIKVPFEKYTYIEEKISPMLQVILIRDSDVESGTTNVKYHNVRIAIVHPSINNSPTTLVAIVDDNQMKEFANLTHLKFSIFINANIEAANSVMVSINKILSDPNLQAKAFPKVLPNVNNSFRKQMANELNSLFYNCPKIFNQKQKEAIYAITRPVNTTFLLFGPPGTGKTYTVVEAVRQLIVPTVSKMKIPANRRILICTPSNMAADAVAEAIVDRKFIETSEVFRLMSASRDAFCRNDKLDRITKTSVLLDRNNEVIRPVYDCPSEELLQEYKIIICTLGSVPKLAKNVDAGHFSHIFIDEAAQSPEMESWLPIGHLATKNTRFILSGDPKQLGPVSMVDCFNNPALGFKQSLLARLILAYSSKDDPQFLVQLTDNHRSHHEIVKISSQLFYGDTLVPTFPNGHDSLCRVPFLGKTNFPIIFHSVNNGAAEQSGTTKSSRNLAEAKVIVQYVNHCLKYVAAKDIGVVSPYKYQAETIRDRLKNSDITVETVERFQGSERRVILISTVRTGPNLGFIGDDLRLNTAITRAKHLLIVVGHKASLTKHKSWKGFIDFCQKNGSVVNAIVGEKEVEQRLNRLRLK